MKNLFLAVALIALNLFAAVQVHAAPEDFASFREAMQTATDDLTAQNYEDAKADLDAALQLAKTDNEKRFVYFGLGNLSLILQNYQEARVQLTQALALSKEDAAMQLQILSSIGSSFLAEKDYEKARSSYDEAMAIENVSEVLKFSVQLQVAQTYFLEKKFEAARTELAKITAYQQIMPVAELTAWTFDGKIFAEQGNTIKARERYQQVLAVDAEALLKNQIAQFKPTYENLIRLYQQQAQLGIAESYLKDKDLKRAKSEYEKTLAMEKLNPLVKVEAEKQLKAIADLEKPDAAKAKS